jgi:hypothetical protein
MAPVSGVGEQEFSDLLQKIEHLIQKVSAKANEFVDRINKILARVPDIIGAGIRTGTERFIALMNKIFHELDKVVNKPGWPPTLLSHGSAWADRVGGPVTKLVGDADSDQSTVLEQWTGDAAEAYKRILPPQQKALISIKKDYTDAIHSAMTAMSAAIVAFWASVAVALVALVAGTIAALASTATIAGAPAAPFIAIGACLTFVGALAAGSATLFGVASVQNGNLRDKVNEYSASKTGHWPRSTADLLSDGTVRDTGPGGPDTTDWHVR